MAEQHIVGLGGGGDTKEQTDKLYEYILGLTGKETFSIDGIEGGQAREVTVRADDKQFTARVRIDTPKEVEYFRHGGILQFVLRQLLAA